MICVPTPAERSHESFIHGRITGSRVFFLFLFGVDVRRRRWFRPYFFIYIHNHIVCGAPRKRNQQPGFFLFARDGSYPVRQLCCHQFDTCDKCQRVASSIPDEIIQVLEGPILNRLPTRHLSGTSAIESLKRVCSQHLVGKPPPRVGKPFG